MFESVQALLAEHGELQQELADPALHADAARAKKVNRRYAELSRIVAANAAWQEAQDDLEAARELAKEDDAFAEEVPSLEESLAQAQERLILSEKQAVVAELAGTTAHELNQPLTSVMGYAELLLKRMAPDDANRRAVDIVLREAARMAEIVRKIGKITKYETKAYVGGTTILDLEKSSELNTAGEAGETGAK